MNSTPDSEFLWQEKFRIKNIPAWVYTQEPEPKSINECRAKISMFEYTLKDIDLQIELRELESRNGNSRHANGYELDAWKIKALKSKQSHSYLLNAYTYWLILHEPETCSVNTETKIDKVIRLLIDEPEDFVAQLERLG